MDYYISVDSTPYHQWQLELLIESFRNIGLEDNLIISLNKECGNFNKNILSHKKTYYFSDIGTLKGYEPLNKFYSLATFLKKGILKQPFLMLYDIDLIIKKEINMPDIKGSPDCLYQIDPLFTFQQAEKECFFDTSELNKKLYEENWISLGNIIGFNNFPLDFFDGVSINAEKLIINQILEDKKIWHGTLKTALALSLIEGYNKIRFIKSNNFVMPAMSMGDSFFIEYKKGILPDFHKSMFLFDPPYYLSLGNPIEVLSKIHNCPNTKYISDLAMRYLSN